MSLIKKYSTSLEANASNCMTPGAVYKITIKDKSVAVTVSLPIELGIDEKQAKDLETNLHNAVELVLAPYFK